MGGDAYQCTDLVRGRKKLLAQKNISQVLLNIKSTFENEIVHVANIKQLRKQKLFPTHKRKFGGKSTTEQPRRKRECIPAKLCKFYRSVVHIR